MVDYLRLEFELLSMVARHKRGKSHCDRSIERVREGTSVGLIIGVDRRTHLQKKSSKASLRRHMWPLKAIRISMLYSSCSLEL